jgi:hypothetical protein
MEEQLTRQKWWNKRWVQNVGIVLVAVAGVYLLIWNDVRSRAKEAYMEAEKYMSWHKDPQLKQAHFNKLFVEEKEKLTEHLRRNKIDDNEYRRKLDVLEFDRDFHMNESSLKYAYQWYKDTYELFSPPESKWVVMARQKAPQTLALWKEELDAKGIKYEDYMFE